MDPGSITTLALAGAGAVASATGWAMRTYINTQVAAVDQKINIHVAEDRIMHATIKESLDRIESKLDRREKRDVKREHDDD